MGKPEIRRPVPNPPGSPDTPSADKPRQSPDVALLATLVEEALQGILIHHHTEPLYANKAMLAMFGYESFEEIRALGTSLMLVAPHERSRLDGYQRSRHEGGAPPTSYSAVGIRKDGSTFTVEIVNRMVEWQGEEAIYSAFYDITERKAAEEALRESERNYRELMEEASDAMFITDIRGNFLMLNQRAVDLCGYTLENWKGFGVRDVVREEDVAIYMDSLEQVTIEGAAKFDVRIRHKDGTWLSLELTTRRIGHDRIQSIARDVTRRRKAEDALRESHETLQHIIDVLPLWVTVKDLEGKYLMYNRQWQVFNGWGDESYIGRPAIQSFDFAAPEQKAYLASLDEKVIRTGRNVEFEEVVLDGIPGRRVILIVSKIPLKDQQGRVTAVLTASLDISTRKQAEEELVSERRLFRTMFDAIPYWVYVKDRKSRYVMLNQALLDFYRNTAGLEENQLIGMHIKDLPIATPEEKATFLEDDRIVLESGHGLESETTFTMPDGILRHQHETKYPLHNEQGEIVGQVGISQDITTQKQAEEAIRASELKFRQLFEESLLGVVIHADHRILFANPAFAAIFG